jgi:5-methylcytosine-specific restriction protein B
MGSLSWFSNRCRFASNHSALLFALSSRRNAKASAEKPRNPACPESRAALGARQGELAQDIAATFHVLYPLWLLATAEHADVLSRYWDDDAPDELPPTVRTREWLLEETSMAEELLDELESLLADKPQIVLYGPPGTGKTWLAERIARRYAAEDAIQVIQFHASYGYEDFIEGLRPVVDPATGQLRYEVVPGIFRELCERARRHPREKFVLIIDEINRGNLPRIFGELLYLLDRRGTHHHVTLGLSRTLFSVPENVILIGTMNTADQSIALIDSALRRRFQFVRLYPDPGLLERWLRRNGCRVTDVPRLLDRLNQELQNAGVDRNLLVGHSYFMRPNLDPDALRRIWERSVVPALEDHFYNQIERLDQFSYDEFVEPDLDELQIEEREV